jgi:hypothetical protein
MYKRAFPLERGGPKRLALVWSYPWRNMQVTIDGDLLGTITGGSSALSRGCEFTTADGARIGVSLVKVGLFNRHLQVTRNGVPLPDSIGDPEAEARLAYQMLFFIAALNVVGGAIVLIAHVDVLIRAGVGWPTILVGAVYAALAWTTKARDSSIALAIGIGLFALDGLVSIITTTSAGGQPAVGGIIGRIIFLIPMWRGFRAMRRLRAEPTSGSVGASSG